MRLRFFVLFIISLHIHIAYSQTKPKIIVLTDIGGDPDDEQSMVRFLLYANEFDIQAFCITSRLGHGQDIKPAILENQIDAYSKVIDNLRLHADDYPDPKHLMSKIKKGQGNQYDLGKGFDTEASNSIIDIVERSEDIVHILVWGGLRELAQALWNYDQAHSDEEVKQFCEKIFVHAIGDQDKHRSYILDHFRDIQFIANAFVFYGDFGIRELAAFRGMYMTGDHSMQDAEWVRSHIHGHGELSETYPLSAHNTNGMKEGDTPSFLGLIPNGLQNPLYPNWGGWGGRFRLLRNRLYIDAQDFLDGELNERHTVSRWRLAFQRDFMARLDWCIKPFHQVNHHPTVIVNNHVSPSPLVLKVERGKRYKFDASQSYDRDQNTLNYDWYIYREISGNAEFTGKLKQRKKVCQFTIPENFNSNEIHLILEVQDNGIPNLTTYKRIVMQVVE